MKESRIPERREVNKKNCWDLSSLFPDEASWETGWKECGKLTTRLGQFKGTLGRSPKALKAGLDALMRYARLGERLMVYAYLRRSENVGDSRSHDRVERCTKMVVEGDAASRYMRPEILAIAKETMDQFLESEELKEYGIYLEKVLRFRPYVLSEREEILLAKQEEFGGSFSQIFESLTDVDMDFGSIETEEGTMPLTHATAILLLQKRDRSLREKAYRQYFDLFDAHKNTLATLYAGSVKRDCYLAEVRGYPDALSAALFPDRIDRSVYDNLIDTVSSHLAPLHRYYRLRRKVLGVEALRLYDLRVSLEDGVETNYPFDKAVDEVIASMAPLGQEYLEILRQGLTGRWVDRYENKGKLSGAFSHSSYRSDPFILMNYKENDLGGLFTLAHEAGHSMHSWYAARHNLFPNYDYTIFEAEVASTFNEELLATSLLKKAKGKKERLYLMGRRIDDMTVTLFRQTMFAEYELKTHQWIESGVPLTVDNLRKLYRDLLEKYCGGEVVLDERSDLVGMRIPHFYRAFYVYKYATGFSAAVALAERVLGGGPEEGQAYLSFLKTGGSLFPLESLRRAGVDMRQPAPVASALAKFGSLVDMFEKAITDG